MVVLRDFIKQDVEYLVEYLNNDEVTKFLTSRIPTPYTLENAEWWVDIGSKEKMNKAIVVEGVFVGVVGAAVGEYEYQRSAEIGYWLAQKYWGKGIATEAVKNFTTSVFSSTEVVRLFAPVFGPNIASMRVLEKCGYKQEAVLQKALFKNGSYFNCHLFAKVRS